MRTQLRNGMVVCLLAVPVFALAQFENQATVASDGLSLPYVPPGSLYDSGQSNGTTSLVSQDDDTGGWFARTADDFSIPAGECATGQFDISQIRIQMTQQNAVPQAFGLDLFADNGAGTAPFAPGGVPPMDSFIEASQTNLGPFGGTTTLFEASFDTTGLTLSADTTYWVSGFGSDGAANGAGFNNYFAASEGALGSAANGVIVAPGAGVADWALVDAIIGPPALAFSFAIDGECGAPPEHARFLVAKDFNDDNEAEVEVTLSCNTGLPLEQTTTISEGDGVNFVIGDFEQGALNCTVTEAPVDGYSTFYDDTDGVSPDDCSWEDLQGGQYTCAIDNELEQSVVTVTKEWIDENPQFDAINYAEAYWSCSNVASDGFSGSSGYLDFYGNPGSDTFNTYPDWENGTTCSITEVGVPDGGIEIDDSDCQTIVLFPGEDASCTIVNTRLYEGIPTLSHYGLAVLALMMLGMGLVGFRRFV